MRYYHPNSLNSYCQFIRDYPSIAILELDHRIHWHIVLYIHCDSFYLKVVHCPKPNDRIFLIVAIYLMYSPLSYSYIGLSIYRYYSLIVRTLSVVHLVFLVLSFALRGRFAPRLFVTS